MIAKETSRKDSKSAFGDLAKYVAGLVQGGPIPQDGKVPVFEPGKTAFDDLSSYISDSKQAGKKVGLLFISNCSNNDYDLAVAEIKATQALNTRSKGNKTYHLILSFRENDNPTSEMVKEIEEAFCDALGFGEHQRIAALHVNTEHPHIHIAINKIHPKTFRVHEAYRSYHTLSDVCRQMEQKYGLEVDNGIDFDAKKKNPGIKLGPEAAAMEKHSGLMSFETWIKRGPAKALREILSRPDASWEQVHRSLAKYDLVMRKRGAGLVISSRTRKLFVKASDVLREAGKGAIEKKLGPYVEPSDEIMKRKAKLPYYAKALHNHNERDALYQKYQKERSERETRKTLDLRSLREERSTRLSGISEDFERRRERVRLDTLLGKRRKRSVYSKLREERLEAVNGVVADIGGKRRSIYAENKGITWQDYLIREAVDGNSVALQVLRSNSRKAERDIPRDSFDGPRRKPDFLYWNLSPRVYKNGDVFYQVDGGVIRDEGEKISVENMSDEGLKMALEISTARFGSLLNVDGSREFKARVVQVAAEAGLEVEFSLPWMQAALEALMPDPGKEHGLVDEPGNERDMAKKQGKGRGRDLEIELEREKEMDIEQEEELER